MVDEMSRLEDEMTPLLQRLESLKNTCFEACPFARYTEERQKLLSGLLPLMSRLDALKGDFDASRQAMDTSALVEVLGGAVSGKKTSAGASIELTLSRRYSEFSHSTHDFRIKAHNDINSEALAYQYAQADFKKLRLLKRSAAAAALLMLSAFGAVYWRRTRGLASPAAPPQAGGVLKAGYRIDSELGRGSLGAVYAAVELGPGRKVALRRASPADLPSRKARGLFLSQARRAAALKHPHIVETYAVFEEDGQVFQALEFVGGRPLGLFLENGRRLPLRSAKGVLRQAASALDCAHALGIVHGGLKSSKILLPEQDFLKIRDFGICPLDPGPYLAPEREQGAQGAPSHESDIFALGALFYEMLAGRPPYERDSLAQKQRMLYIPLSKLAPELPAALDGVILKALAADPRARHRSVSELAAAVEAIPG